MRKIPFALALLLGFAAAVAAQIRPPRAFCPQVANYTIDAQLDTEKRLIQAQQLLEWTNPSDTPAVELWFHLYWNAFRNNRSTFLMESAQMGRTRTEKFGETDWGRCSVDDIRIPASGDVAETDLKPTLRFRHPDDNNLEDRTVFSVRPPRPVEPGETIQLRISFSAQVPRPVSRTGVIRDSYFIAQWFPKLGVFEGNGWNCHQYHAHSEFFADYGTYDVRLTVPAGYVVGATGEERGSSRNPDGTATHRFVQHSVHDFAWTADPGLLKYQEDYAFLPGRTVHLILLLQPHHRHLRERYLQAVRHAVTYASLWYGEYPYTTITCVDPAFNSGSGGMEYPTFFTGGAYFIAPRGIPRPESVTIHEFGHGYFYGLIGSNEFEFPWMDEGMNSYLDTKIYYTAYGEPVYSQNYFGIPVAFPKITLPIESQGISSHRQTWNMDILQRSSWGYMSGASYGANAYAKGQLMMLTLERVLGEEIFSEMIKAYSTRWWWKHPQPADFFDVVAEFGGRDKSDLLDQFVYSSARLDYAVGGISNQAVRPERGWFEDEFRMGEKADSPRFETEVLIRRLGDVTAPVEILVLFENGRRVRENWDGRYRWKKLRYRSPFRIIQAVVDPDFKYVLDLNRSNNSFTLYPDRVAPLKWTSRWLLWIQHTLELFTMIGG